MVLCYCLCMLKLNLMNRSLFRFLILSAFLFFIACEDNAESDSLTNPKQENGENGESVKSSEAEILSISFSDPVVSTERSPQMANDIIIFYVVPGTSQSALTSLVPEITISEGASIDPVPGEPVDFSQGPRVFTVTAEDGVTTHEYIIYSRLLLFEEALIIKMTFDYPFVVSQPSIEGNNISFTTQRITDPQLLKALAPVIEVSKGATVSPASGVPVDFSKGAVKYTVISENGQMNTYTISCKSELEGEMSKVYRFEDCNANSFGDHWTSINPIIGVLKLFGKGYSGGNAAFVVDDANSGSKAVKVTTLYTAGAGLMNLTFPKVTPGAMFMGSLQISISAADPIKLKFGIPFTQLVGTQSKKITDISGFYKYKSGPIFYNPSGIQLVEKTDTPSIMAFLYKISNENESLGIEDLMDIVNNNGDFSRFAAYGMFTGSATEQYTHFHLPLTYTANYIPDANYRFAVVLLSSNSAEGGAPESELIVDDITVYWE